MKPTHYLTELTSRPITQPQAPAPATDQHAALSEKAQAVLSAMDKERAALAPSTEKTAADARGVYYSDLATASKLMDQITAIEALINTIDEN